MNDHRLDKALRSAKPEIQPKGAFTAQVMERIGTVPAPHRRRRLASTWMWAATTTAVFAVMAVFILLPNDKPGQVAENPQVSQTNAGFDTNSDSTDSTGSSGHTQLAKSVQDDIDAINSGISSIDSAEYSDSGLSETALYN